MRRNTIILIIAIFQTLALFLVASPTSPISAAAASLYFIPDSIKTSLNQEFEADIMVDTGGNEIGGVGAIITYDPDTIAVVNIKQGTIFGDYPLLSYDNSSGTLSVSGIVSSPSNLYKGVGVVATVTFVLRNNSPTAITFNYTSGSTTDSNIAVMYGSGDILSEVHGLTVSASHSDSLFQPVYNTVYQTMSSINKTAFSNSQPPQSDTVALSPLGTIPSQAPITDPNRSQAQPEYLSTQSVPYGENTSVVSVHTSKKPSVSTQSMMIIGGVLICFLTLVFLIVQFYRYKKSTPDINEIKT